MRDSDILQLQVLIRNHEWDSVYGMLDDAQGRAVTPEDIKREIYWRVAAFEGQGRFQDAIELLRKNASFFNSQSLVHLDLARYLLQLGRDQEALEELEKAPIDEEIENHYGLAIDAKFFYFYLLAKSGDTSVKDRLPEIPDNYRHIAMGGKFLTKADIVALLH